MSDLSEVNKKINLARQIMDLSDDDRQHWWNTATRQERRFAAEALDLLETHMHSQMLDDFDPGESLPH